MSIVILRIAAALYAGAAAAYILYFARPRHARLATVGFWLLAVAFAVQAIAIGVGCAEYGGAEFFGFRGGLAVVAWFVAGAYLLLQRFYPLPTLGAFITPLVLLVIGPAALFGDPTHPTNLQPEQLRNPTLTAHILAALLGLALFGIACAAAGMYLLQEREVKGKRFGVLFLRLPSLDALDRMVQRLVRAGFVVYTVALVAGTITASVVWNSAWSWDPQQVASLTIWTIYGGLVQLRHNGWHGRRYALLTVAGFMLVAASYVSLKTVPGITRHAGDYGMRAPAGGTQ